MTTARQVWITPELLTAVRHEIGEVRARLDAVHAEADRLGEEIARLSRQLLDLEVIELRVRDYLNIPMASATETRPPIPAAPSGPTGPPPPPALPPRISGRGRPARHWQAVRDVLRREGRPLTLHEIVDRLAGLGHTLLGRGKAARESIRYSLRARPDVFRKLDGGRWALTEAGGSAAPESTTYATRIEAVLRDRPEGMRGVEIVEELAARGGPLPENPRYLYPAVRSALERHPEKFRKVGRGYWKLIEDSPSRE